MHPLSLPLNPIHTVSNTYQMLNHLKQPVSVLLQNKLELLGGNPCSWLDDEC